MMDTTATPIETPAGVLRELHRACFACGADNPGGLNLRFIAGADGISTAEWQPSPGFGSYPGCLHGGVIATLLDSAMVHALFAMGIAGVTAELMIRYGKSVNVHETLRVIGWVESERRGVFLCKARIEQSGLPCVRATAKFMSSPDFSPHPARETQRQAFLPHPPAPSKGLPISGNLKASRPFSGAA